jgi:sterol desaturase/sphingolipid hydroxylase (fatty acid hydroxylase superfamily)
VLTPLLAAPVVIMLWFFSPLFLVVFSLVFVSHHVVWATTHKEMHIPTNAFFRQWFLYKWLARNHWVHHKYRNVNYNIAFPLVDHLFGTYRPANPRDKEQMSKIGL